MSNHTRTVTITYLTKNIQSLINDLEEGKLDSVNVVDGQTSRRGNDVSLKSKVFTQPETFIAKLVRWNDYNRSDPADFAYRDVAPQDLYQMQSGSWMSNELYQTVRRLRVNQDVGTAGVEGGSVTLSGASSPNGDIEYTSSPATSGTSVEHVVSGTNTERSITVSSGAITVNVATDADGNVDSTETSASIASFVNSSDDAAALVHAEAQGDGSGLVAAAGSETIPESVDTSGDREPQVIAIKRSVNDTDPRAAIVGATLAEALNL